MMSAGSGYRLTIVGSSHGPEVGVSISGVPAGTVVALDLIQAHLDRRRPVGRRLATKRQEEDRLVVDSGIVAGIADGRDIRMHVANEDIQRGPYDRLRDTPRPGHADFPARVRYGPDVDLSGGGIFSGRMTVGLVIAGAIASQMLQRRGVDISSFTRSVGGILATVGADLSIGEIRRRRDMNEVGCPDPEAAARMEEAIAMARKDGDSVGGTIETRIVGCPIGLGEPFFDSIESTVARLAFSVPAVKGIEFGSGFRAGEMRGSAHNDPFAWEGDRVVTRTNNAGGILGGLATGMPIVFRVVVKPTSSIARPQQTVNLVTHRTQELVVTGRHDPCIVPRAVVVLESVAACAVADLAISGGFLP
ncbi:MAG: chorismate synthase [Thermoplasmata archaeon]|nr:chorismate synthase [Thermoplasmata archaeon]